METALDVCAACAARTNPRGGGCDGRLRAERCYARKAAGLSLGTLPEARRSRDRAQRCDSEESGAWNFGAGTCPEIYQWTEQHEWFSTGIYVCALLQLPRVGRFPGRAGRRARDEYIAHAAREG